ncbi:MAG: site-2 protease family protein [Ruminococcus sp.]|nr:site-2 protease family protein [Ruminococcus sp.]
MFSELIALFNGQGDFMSIVIHILAILMVIFLVLPFHEWAHAWVASLLGNTSIKYRGRLSLNPLSHIDYMGALCLLLFGFGWAKPVPVDDRNFKNPKVGMAITALAGPVANIVAGIAGGLIFYALLFLAPQFAVNTLGGYVMIFLNYYIVINCSLAVFNLLPIPPLDGSKILFAFLPDRLVYKFYQYQQMISMLLIVLLFMGVLDVPLSILQSALMKFITFICSFPFKLFA